MKQSSGSRSQNPDSVLTVIDSVIELCGTEHSDPVVEYEISQLRDLRPLVQEHWPFPSEVKASIDLGPFAAKNIADWNTPLADTLMRLDYSLQHDGAGLEHVIQTANSPKTQGSLVEA